MTAMQACMQAWLMTTNYQQPIWSMTAQAQTWKDSFQIPNAKWLTLNLACLKLAIYIYIYFFIYMYDFVNESDCGCDPFVRSNTLNCGCLERNIQRRPRNESLVQLCNQGRSRKLTHAGARAGRHYLNLPRDRLHVDSN